MKSKKYGMITRSGPWRSVRAAHAVVIWSAMHGVVALEIAKCKDEWVEWRPMDERTKHVIEVLLRGVLR